MPRAKNFIDLWREQKLSGTPQPRYPTRPTIPPNYQFPSGGFATDWVYPQRGYAGPATDDTHDQKAKERANRLATLDQSAHSWFQQLAEPSILDASLDTLDRDIRRMKVGY